MGWGRGGGGRGDHHPGVQLLFFLPDRIYPNDVNRFMGSGDMAGFALDCLWDVGQVPWLLQLTEGDFVDMLVAPCVMSFKILGYQRSTIRASTGFQTLTRLPRVENVYIGESAGVKPCALRALWELRLGNCYYYYYYPLELAQMTASDQLQRPQTICPWSRQPSNRLITRFMLYVNYPSTRASMQRVIYHPTDWMSFRLVCES